MARMRVACWMSFCPKMATCGCTTLKSLATTVSTPVKWPGRAVPSQRSARESGVTTTIRSPEGKLRTVSGVYSAIDPPRRLVFTWAWDDDNGVRGHETQVTVTLEPTPGGTRLRLVQEDFQNREVRDLHGGGWGSSLNKLQRLAG